jgi:arabinogalactan oligomer/maltooligosaccharide transport system substrate-binding protein
MKKLFVSLVLLLGLGFSSAQGISVWTHFGETDLEWLQSEAASFEAAFGVPVQLTRIELGELKQKMLLSAPQGEAADLIVPIPHDQLGELAAGGVLADMSEFATEDYLADLSEAARLAFTFNGRLFGLPIYIEGPALIVNTDLLPESELPTTYEELIAKAQELTTGDTYGFLYDNKNFYFSYNWLHSSGGYVFARDEQGNLVPGDVGLANEGAVEGAEQIKALQYEHNLIPPGTDSAVTEGLFNEGAAAMMYNGPWAIANAEAAGIPVAVMPVPPTEDGTEFSGFIGVQGVLMNEFSENKADAANFAKWITRPEAQLALAETSNRIPASQEAAAQIDDPVLAGFSEAYANAEPMPNIPEMGAVWGPMGDALTAILESPDSNVAQILEGAAAQIQGN